jgi:hypothetical protein
VRQCYVVLGNRPSKLAVRAKARAEARAEATWKQQRGKRKQRWYLVHPYFAGRVEAELTLGPHVLLQLKGEKG